MSRTETTYSQPPEHRVPDDFLERLVQAAHFTVLDIERQLGGQTATRGQADFIIDRLISALGYDPRECHA